MNKKINRIAAMLLTSGVLLACLSMSIQPYDNKSMMRDYDPVVVAKNNTLAQTPTEIENLAKGLNIDLRNSAYMILQRVKESDSYKWGENSNEQIDFFVLYNLIEPTNDDPAVRNLAEDDMNDCLGAYGDQGNCYEILWYGSTTWKARVIDKILTTNLIYQTPELLEREWYINCDMSKYIAYIIDTLNHDSSISDLLNPNERIQSIVSRYKKGEL